MASEPQRINDAWWVREEDGQWLRYDDARQEWVADVSPVREEQTVILPPVQPFQPAETSGGTFGGLPETSVETAAEPVGSFAETVVEPAVAVTEAAIQPAGTVAQTVFEPEVTVAEPIVPSRDADAEGIGLAHPETTAESVEQRDWPAAEPMTEPAVAKPAARSPFGGRSQARSGSARPTDRGGAREQQAPRPAEQLSTPHRVSTPVTGEIVAGTGLLPLPGERIVYAISRFNDQATNSPNRGLHLTSLRVILFGQDRVLNIFPSGRAVQAAFIGDVDSAAVRTRRLPTWMLVLGLVLVLGGLGLISQGNTNASFEDSNAGTNQAAGTVVALAGAALFLAWLFVRKEALVFTVGGVDLIELFMTKSGSGTDVAASFINAFSDLKNAGRTSPDGEADTGPRELRG